MRVEVYRNLHKKCFSVRAVDGPNKGRVVLHTDAILLKNAKFIVQKGGQDRVRKERRKHVHAFVRGEVRAVSSFASNTMQGLLKYRDFEARRFTYNPYENDTFIDLYDRSPVETAEWAALGVNGNWYMNERTGRYVSERLLLG